MPRTQHGRHALNPTCTPVPHVQRTTYTTCAHHHMYTAPPTHVYTMPHVHCTTIQCVHNTTCTQYHAHDMYIAPHAWHGHNTICTQRHLYNLYTIPHAHNTTCTFMHATPYVHSATCRTYTQHHMYISLHIQHVHSIIFTQHCISNMHTTPYAIFAQHYLYHCVHNIV